MRSNIAVVRSMLSALAYVLDDKADQYFTMREDARRVFEELDRLPKFTDAEMQEYGMADVCDTMLTFATSPELVAGATVESEAYYGCILAHYTPEGDIVRFVAIRA